MLFAGARLSMRLSVTMAIGPQPPGSWEFTEAISINSLRGSGFAFGADEKREWTRSLSKPARNSAEAKGRWPVDCQQRASSSHELWPYERSRRQALLQCLPS